MTLDSSDHWNDLKTSPQVTGSLCGYLELRARGRKEG